MATSNQIITMALKNVNAIADDATSLPHQLQIGFDKLKNLIARLSMKSLTVPFTVQDTFNTVGGQYAYTIGSGAFDINSVEPVDVNLAYFRLNSVDYPLEVISFDQWSQYYNKTTYHTQPSKIAFKRGVGNGVFYLYPVPDSSYPVYVESYKQIDSLTDVNSTINILPEYASILEQLLSVELLPIYPVEQARGNVILSLATDSMKTLRDYNASQREYKVNMPHELTHRRTRQFDIRRGY